MVQALYLLSKTQNIPSPEMHLTQARGRGGGHRPEFVTTSGVNVSGLPLSLVVLGPGF